MASSSWSCEAVIGGAGLLAGASGAAPVAAAGAGGGAAAAPGAGAMIGAAVVLALLAAAASGGGLGVGVGACARAVVQTRNAASTGTFTCDLQTRQKGRGSKATTLWCVNAAPLAEVGFPRYALRYESYLPLPRGRALRLECRGARR